MAPKILESVKAETIRKRFQIIASLLSGKQDISTGRPSQDIAADVELSPSSIRNFLNKLYDLGFVKKDFVTAGSLPICPGISWPNHNEYHLTEAGIQYVTEQLLLWENTGHYDETGQIIKNHLKKTGSKE
ncbi:MAG: ArsR family transcriptional regulator [Syntrophaceae bacterium]|nr:ArsR family transcriptional regulator [Syntrophaceae bacterium]